MPATTDKKWKIAIIILSILVAIEGIALFFVGCQGSTVVDEAVLYADAIRKTVEIRCTNDGANYSYATGAVVSSDGKILTNKHVVVYGQTEFSTVQVRFYDKEDYEDARIVKVSANSDLALLSVDRECSGVFEVGGGVQGGQKVYTIGNPNGFGLSFSGGHVSSPKRLVSYEGNIIQAVQTSIVINEGNSGGPLFDDTGKLIGVVSFRLRDNQGEVIQGVSFALHIDTVNAFLS